MSRPMSCLETATDDPVRGPGRPCAEPGAAPRHKRIQAVQIPIMVSDVALRLNCVGGPTVRRPGIGFANDLCSGPCKRMSAPRTAAAGVVSGEFANDVAGIAERPLGCGRSSDAVDSRGGPGTLGSDGSACPSAAGEHTDHPDDNDRADDRCDDRADVERAVDRIHVQENARKEAADERADDAEHDVTDHAEALVTLDQEPGEIPGDRAEDDPRDDAHLFLHPMRAVPAISIPFHPEVRDGVNVSGRVALRDYADAAARNKLVSAPRAIAPVGATLQLICDGCHARSGARGMPGVRRCDPIGYATRGSTEDRISMVRPVIEGVPLGAAKPRHARTDVAMNVLQYGTAILAIVAVTLLAGFR